MVGYRGLVVVLAVAQAGCIFAEPPEREAEQTRIFLDLNGAAPSVTKILSVQSTEELHFTVPFASEDAGEEVLYGVHRNFGLVDASKVTLGSVPGSTLSDETRKFSFDYRPPDTSGCFQLTLVACHDSNFVLSEFRCVQTADDMALATWWINVADIDQPPSLVDCPQASGGVAP